MFKEVKTSKATGIDNLEGRFLKNGWKNVLFSQMKRKIAEVKLLHKKRFQKKLQLNLTAATYL